MTPTPDQLRLCAYLMEHPEVPWQWRYGGDAQWNDQASYRVWMPLFDGQEIRIHPEYNPPTPRYSREGKTLLILHNHDCDQFGVITGESPEHLWFSRHGGYFKLSKDSGEVETLKPAEF
jgi:hypothetical protein